MARVLVVDDETTTLKNIARCLRRSGFEVIIATNCANARSEFHRYRVDLLCVDFFLPDGNGLELLTEFRGFTPGLPAIVISSSGSVETTMRAGCFDRVRFLLKPFSLADLREIILGSARPA